MSIAAALVLIAIFSTALSEDCACGVENSASRIVGGTEVSQGKYPWMAYLLTTSGDDEYSCGGAIINNLYILTAAHCLDDTDKVQVGVGSNYDDTQNTMQDAESFFQHPEWDSVNTINDIALVKLSKPLVWSKTIRPICLPPKDMDLSGDLIAAGWGITKTGNEDNAHKLLETTIREESFEECEDYWGELLHSQFCAGGPGHDTCEGDSGGPIMKHSNGRVYNVGIVSFGGDVCGVDENSVYSRVTSFLDWIKENTSDGTYCDN